MEKMNAPVKVTDGLLSIGYVANLKNGVYIRELQEYLNDTDQDPTSQDLRKRATNAEIILLNKHGYPKDAAGRTVPASRAKFKAFNTGYIHAGKDVYGWFEKNESGTFVGVTWGTLQELRAYARLREQTSHLFKMGDFYFDNIDDCQDFLEDIAQATIPENLEVQKQNHSHQVSDSQKLPRNAVRAAEKRGKVLKKQRWQIHHL